jgi:competence protein ComEA
MRAPPGPLSLLFRHRSRATRALAAATIAGVRDLSRSQLLVYGAVAAALLVVGIRWVQGSGSSGGSSSDVSYASEGSGASSGGHASFGVGSSSEDVVVDVAGEVSDPGVYRMPAGSRVNDAVARAGGATGAADLGAINLAARLGDGQQVVVPGRVSVVAASGAADPAAAASAGAATGPISLGSATVADLDTIDGIGPVTAQKIIEFRDQHGGVSSVDQLSQISGIGPATMQSLRSSLQP